MSHYTTLRTKITDESALVQALNDMGFVPEHVECHAEPQHLVGYHGDQRPETAHVIIRRQHVGSASNDLGFVRGEDGSYQAIISEYDQRTGYGSAWLQRLQQRYAYHTTLAHLARQGFALAEERTEAGTVHMILSRRA